MNTIGDRIRIRREELGLSQDDLAQKTGYKSRSSINKIETGNQGLTQTKIKAFARALETTVSYILDTEEDFTSFKNIIPIKKKSVPMLGEIACGEPSYADHQYNTYVQADDNLDADFCLRCKGDSMIGDGINDGDIIFIRKQDYVENGEIACVIIDDEATLKHVYISEDNITLIASNPSVAPMVYGEHDAGTIKILGKAIALSRIL